MSELGGVSFKEAFSSTQGKIAIASGVGVVAWYYWRQKNAAASTAAAGTTAAAGSTAAYSDGSLEGQLADTSSYGASGGSGGAFGDSMGSISSYPSGTTTSASNASWVQQGLAYLESLGYDAQTAATALAGYTQGQSLTTAQQGLVTTALGGVGPAPVAVPITTTLSPPTGVTSTSGAGTGTGTTTVGSTTPNTHTISVSKGETQKEIITAAGESYKTFIGDNPSLAAKGSKVTTGQKVVVR
jgi:hypothetical protein